uniref:Fibrinogen C-terminal domain-containing protein n=1 Tax=Anopheles dirus TaxID=7168 RepID=A0A182N7L5_9DIPT
MLEYQSFANNLQTEEKITVLSSRVDNLVKSIETLAWNVQQAGETVHQLGGNAKHTAQNLTVMQRDLTDLLTRQKLLLTGHQFGEYLLQRGCNASNLSLTSADLRHVYTSCSKIPFPVSGVYRVQLEKPFKQPMTVLCDQDYESGGWTVIQHRFDGSTNFYRDWNEYRNGFGNLEGEFWLGLDRIHQLTASGPHELVILMEDFDGNRTFARYSQFEIGGEKQKYALTKIEGYSGTAGDSMSDLRGMSFSTLDADNDTWGEPCAVKFTGAWWYAACHARAPGKMALSINDGSRTPTVEQGGAPGLPQPEVIPNVNVYQQKKTLAQGMMDLALLSANANQLRYVLETYERHPYYIFSLIFISLSLLVQVGVGVGLIMNSRYDVNDRKEICKANKINDLITIGIFVITLVNVLISAFGVAPRAS